MKIKILVNPPRRDPRNCAKYQSTACRLADSLLKPRRTEGWAATALKSAVARSKP